MSRIISVLSLAALCLFLMFKLAFAADLNDGLVAWWDFDEPSGNAYDLVSNSPAVAEYSPGRVINQSFGRAADFDGTNDFILQDGYLTITGTTDIAITAWIRTSYTADDQTIISHVPSTGTVYGGYWLKVLTDGTVTFRVYNGNTPTYGVNVTSTGTVNDGEWHHIVAQRTGGTGYIYIDGEEDGTNTPPEFAAISTIYIENIAKDHRSSVLDMFVGSIDELRKYDRALDGDEIALVSAVPAYVGVYKDNASAAESSSTNFNLADGDHTVLFGVVYCEASCDATAMTYNGDAMTYLTEVDHTSAGLTVGVYYMLDDDLPSPGTYALASSVSGSPGGRVTGGFAVYNAKQSAPTVIEDAEVTSNSDVSQSITTPVNYATVLDFIVAGESGGYTANNQTEATDAIFNGSATYASSIRAVDSAGAVTESWTHSVASTNRQLLVSIAVEPYDISQEPAATTSLGNVTLSGVTLN